MKKIIFASMAALAALTAQALSVGQIRPVEGLGAGAYHPVLSPDGSTLLFSAVDHTGLNALDLTTGKVSVLDKDAAAGFNPVFSADGKTVAYRTAAVKDGLLCRDLRSYNLAKKAGKQLQGLTRNDVDLDKAAGKTAYARADYREIVVSDATGTRRITPLADAHSYLWASLSPDGTHLLFSEPFSGVYVANADGTEPRKIADKGDYPAWAGDNIIVYVLTRDDGYVTLSSQLIAVDLNDNSTTVITSPENIVGEATAATNGTVIFNTVDGSLYTVTIK